MTAKTIALLGNSHVGSIKKAYDLPESRSLKLTLAFFARPNGRGGLNGLNVIDRKLVATDPELRSWFLRTGGLDYIAGSDYDAFWVCGFGPNPARLVRAARTTDRHTYSSAVKTLFLGAFEEEITTNFQNSPLYKVASKVRSITTRPIFVTPKPLFSESHECRHNFSNWTDIALVAEWRNAWNRAIAKAFTEIDAVLISQPEPTTKDIIFTKQEFSNADHTHMNASFGWEMLRFMDGVIARETTLQ